MSTIETATLARILGLPEETPPEQVLNAVASLADLRAQIRNGVRATVESVRTPYPSPGRCWGQVVLTGIEAPGVCRLGGFLGAEVIVLTKNGAVQGALEDSNG